MQTLEKQRVAALTRERLDEVLSGLPGEDLGAVCDYAEDLLAGLVHQNAITELQRIASERELVWLPSHPETFVYGREIFQAKLGKSLLPNETLELVIRPADTTLERVQSEVAQVRVDSDGSVAAFRVMSFGPFSADAERIALVGKETLESGYRWLAEYLRTVLNHNDNRTTSALYSHVRRLFPTSVSQMIWLYLIHEGMGIYVLDSSALDDALASASRRVVCVSSPLRALADFAQQKVEYDKLFSKAAFSAGRAIETPFDLASYAGSSVQIAEKMILESQGPSIVQPLVSGSKMLLTAVYPAICRAIVESTLEQESPVFHNILTDASSAYAALVRPRFQHRGANADMFEKAASYLGAFWGSYGHYS